MVRTQIQLTDAQSESLKRLAAATGVSMAELVRQGVDHVLLGSQASTSADRMRRAMRAFGAFRSGSHDLSARHDDAFADAVLATHTATPVARRKGVHRRAGRP